MPSTGIIQSIAYCPIKRAAMTETDRAELLPGLGLSVEPFHKGKRGLTLLSTQSWAEVCRELGADIPWTTRRANVLIDGLDLPSTVGQMLAIGPVRLLVHGETRPCGLMDEYHPGLKDALIPSMRAGVHAQILMGGSIAVGQSVKLLV